MPILQACWANIAPGLEKGRVIVAHLGSGASLCAMVNGRSVSSTMGFSALDGLPMGTRCGALDPAVVFYMMREDKLDAAAVEKLLYTKAGLLGVSGLSNDMRALREAAAGGHEGARRAIELFVYRICREMGALTAVMGGLDGIVFTAGIGENDPATRAEVLQGHGMGRRAARRRLKHGRRATPQSCRRAAGLGHPDRRGAHDRARDRGTAGR